MFLFPLGKYPVVELLHYMLVYSFKNEFIESPRYELTRQEASKK